MHCEPEETYQSVELFSGDNDSPMQPLPSVSLPPLHAAVYDINKPIHEIEEIVVSDPMCLESVEPQLGFTALHCAARKCSLPLIKMLTRHGALVDSRASNGETPLMVACESGSLFAVHVLCERGATLNVADSLGQTPLHYAARAGAVHILHYLATRGEVDFRAKDNEGNTPLHTACYHHKLETVAYLIRHKRSDIRAPNKQGMTSVHYAAKHGSIEMCWLLLNRTLSSNKKRSPLMLKDANGLTPLDIATRGDSDNHQLLTKRLQTWLRAPDYMRLFPWGWWVFFSALGGVTLLLSLLSFTKLHQPVGFVVAVFLACIGFFLPLSLHRIPHPSGWPNPLMVGGLVAGVGLTTITYFTRVFWVIWPDYAFSFFILAINAFIAQVLYFKLRASDPGLDKLGKLNKDGKPMSIVDVASQATDDEPSYLNEEDDNLLFCTSCEIVISAYSKHCKLCDGCCRGFDHHCMWLTRCIGYNNHRLFLIFMFCLMVDNSFFVYHSLAMMGVVGQTSSLWGMLGVGFSSENAVTMLLLCNLVAAVFAAMNIGQQLLQISRMETTYFDSEGRGAYRKRRNTNFPWSTRLKLVVLFFTNYPVWYLRKPHPQPILTV